LYAPEKSVRIGEKTQGGRWGWGGGWKANTAERFGGGGGGLSVMCIEIKIQIDQRIRDNRRISCGKIAFEINIRVFKDTSQYRFKAQAKTFYNDEIRKFTEQNTIM